MPPTGGMISLPYKSINIFIEFKEIYYGNHTFCH